MTWIGPPPAAIELMGSKTEARAAMRAAGVPIIPGATDPVRTVAEVVAIGEEIGYPLIIKAAAGGGGKGMELVADPSEAERAFEAAQRQGLKYFADDAVYVERYLEDPRHVEAQVLADAHGTVLFLGERDCTIQRRHQKLVEETPSPAVGPELRERIGEIAVNAARAAGYRSAGTIEGLLTATGEYFFMEMNTRIQVEHTVTELVTGLDLVREQILIAQGEPLSVRQEDVSLRGHAIECRINAEDVGKGFLPAPGADHRLRGAVGPRRPRRLRRARGRRDLGALRPDDREADRPRHESRDGAEADAPRARRVPDRGAADADRLPRGAADGAVLHRRRHLPRARRVRGAGAARGGDDGVVLSSDNEVSGGADGTQTRERVVAVEVDGRSFDVRLHTTEPPWAAARPASPGAHRSRWRRRLGRRREPDAGHRAQGPRRGGRRPSTAGQVICVIEAMKMENEIAAPRDGVVTELGVSAGQGSHERAADLRRRGRPDGVRRVATSARSFGASIGEESLTGATLSRPRRSDPSRASRVTVAPVTIGRRASLSLHGALRGARRRTRTWRPTRPQTRLVQLLEADFRQGLLQSSDADWQVLAAGKAPEHPPPAAEPPDRDASPTTASSGASCPKGEPVPFLVELGVMTPEGKVRAQRYDKFRQVNRFLELVEDVLPVRCPRGRCGSSTSAPASRT